MSETYFSVDVETDGLVPGRNAMLSIGAIAYAGTAFEPLDTFSINLVELHGTSPDKDTMEWWKKFPTAWEMTRQNPQPPLSALLRFAEWIRATAKDARPVFCAWPLNFDASFISYYFAVIGEKNPFGIGGLDMRSLWMGLSGMSYVECNDEKVPGPWQSKHAHAHVALEDALQQGDILVAMLKAARMQARFRTHLRNILPEASALALPMDPGPLLTILDQIEGKGPS